MASIASHHYGEPPVDASCARTRPRNVFNDPESTEPTTKSARRVMEIMEAFREVRRPLSLKEICDRLRYPVSSAAALLKSLLVMGYLDYDRPSRTYMPTMRIAFVADWVPEQLFGRINLLGIMAEVQAESSEDVFLGTRSDLFAQYVHVLQLDRPLPYLTPPGTLRPLEGCGLGLLLLSTLGERELDQTIRRINARHADRSRKIDFRLMRTRLGQIADDGYIFTKDLVHPGLGAISLLLPRSPFNRTFAIGIGGAADTLEANLPGYRDILRRAATRVARDAAA